MAKSKLPQIDARVTWITQAEAMQVWHIKSRSTLKWAYWRGHLLMRKSAGVWMVYVPHMRRWFGEPKTSLVIID